MAIWAQFGWAMRLFCGGEWGITIVFDGYLCGGLIKPSEILAKCGGMTRVRLHVALWGMVALWPLAAQAQLDRLPSTAEAGSFERANNVPAKSLSEGAKAQAPAKVAPREVKAPPDAEKLRFRLKDIHVEGATRFDARELLAPHMALRGKVVSVKQIYVVANAIQQRYLDAGYGFVMVYLPPQKITTGDVTLRVVEGYVHRVVMEPDHKSIAVAQAKQTLMAAKPLPTKLLEEQMLLINDLPGVQVKAVVEPDKKAGKEGALLLRLVATHKRFEGSIGVNNFGSRFNGTVQGIATVSVNNALGRDDKTSVTAMGAVPLREARYVAVEHREQVGLRTSVGVQVSGSGNRPGHTLKRQEVKGASRGVMFDVVHTVVRSREENLIVRASVSANDYETDILGTDLYDDKLRVARIGLNYDTVDRLDGSNALNVTLSKGVDAFGARKTGSANLSRAEGHSDFTKVETIAWRLQPVGNSWSFYGLINGQWVSDPLLSSEEFGFGGGAVGRAFDVAELSGDHGLSGTVELRYLGLAEQHDVLMQPFVFYDAGAVWNLDTGGGRDSAAATGFGVRSLIQRRAQVNAALAWPLKHEPTTPVRRADKDPRLGVSLSVPF